MWKKFFYPLIGLSLYLFYIINIEIDEPHMDEIFHFPQAAKYVNGIFHEWDPKITTPPGLYLLTFLIYRPLYLMTGLDFCKISWFRLINSVFIAGTFFVLYRIFQILHKDIEEKRMVLSIFNICIFPLLYFFNFLYYTDCGSTFFVLLMYCLHLRKNFMYAAFAGAVSLVFRQTNIVWVFFVSADETIRCVQKLIRDGFTKKDKKVKFTSFDVVRKVYTAILWRNAHSLLYNLKNINKGYFSVCIAFVIFVAVNGSIALGDKGAHQVSLHIPQIFYFSLFSVFFAAPFLVSGTRMKDFVLVVLMHKKYALVVCAVSMICVLLLSHVHPYLLADNSHLSFYIWKRLLGRNLLTSCTLVLVYIASWVLIFS